MPWPDQQLIHTSRFSLVPLVVGHAAEMAEVLADPSLYRFTGGTPATRADLQRRYAAQVAGAPDDAQWWLNWVVQDRQHKTLRGYVQATVEHGPRHMSADVAWVVGEAFQGRGIATEAALTMTVWLLAQGVGSISAHIHPENEASKMVATRIGMRTTDVVTDGEVKWMFVRSPTL